MSPYEIQSQNNKNVELIACDKCKCTWLSKVEVNRFAAMSQSLGAGPQKVHFEADFTLLKCARCGAMVFPPIDAFRNGHPTFRLYEEMAEEVAGSPEEAEEKRIGTKIQKRTHGVWAHIQPVGRE